MENKENDLNPQIIEGEEIMKILSSLPDNEENRQHIKKFEDLMLEFKKVEIKRLETDQEKQNQSLLLRVLGICDKQIERSSHLINDCENFRQMADILEDQLNNEEKSFLKDIKDRFADLTKRIKLIQETFKEITHTKVVNTDTVNTLKELEASLVMYENSLGQIKECYFSLTKIAKKSSETRETLTKIPDNFLDNFNKSIKRLQMKISSVESQSLRCSQESLATSSRNDDEYYAKVKGRTSICHRNGGKPSRKSEVFKPFHQKLTESTLCLEKNDLESSFLQNGHNGRSSIAKYHKDNEIKHLIDKLKYLQDEINFTQQQLSQALHRQSEIINDQISMAISSKNFNSRYIGNGDLSSMRPNEFNLSHDESQTNNLDENSE